MTTVDIVIPVYNEAASLSRSVRRLEAEVQPWREFDVHIIIADNASTDRTMAVATELALELTRVTAFHLESKGRGRALRTAWLRSHADVVAYMDVDLSTDLRHLLPLLTAVRNGADVAVGSRLAKGAVVSRGWKREFISRSYNTLLRRGLHLRVRDAQCGFKALSRSAAATLLPAVEDSGWFFDTELLVRAQWAGMHIVELPVRWTDDADSRVAIVATAIADLRGIARLRKWHHPSDGPQDRDGTTKRTVIEQSAHPLEKAMPVGAGHSGRIP